MKRITVFVLSLAFCSQGNGQNGGIISTLAGNGGNSRNREVTALAPKICGSFTQQGTKLAGNDAVGSAGQGSSVAVSGNGNTALVGGLNDNGGVGAAWVFTRDSSGDWSQQGDKLVGVGAVGNAGQGSSVAISADGNTALVGGLSDNGGVGAAWVFTRDSSGNWSQQGGKLVGAGAVGNARQGSSVAVSADGNTVLIGGPSDNKNADGEGWGAAWAFTRDTNGNWTQQGDKLVGSGVIGLLYVGAEQGSSVALSADGNTALVGGPVDDNISDNYLGAVWVFTRDSDGNWSQQGDKLVGSGATPISANGFSAQQGSSVALSADDTTALWGGPRDNFLRNNDVPTGAAWVFTRDTNGNWTQQGDKLVGSGGVGYEGIGVGGSSQGSSVALSADGNTALIGGPTDNQFSNVSGAGAAWVFTRDSNGNWSQQGAKLVGSGAVDGTNGTSQGESVSLSADGNTAVIGGPGDNGYVGAVWIFVRASAAACGVPKSVGQH